MIARVARALRGYVVYDHQRPLLDAERSLTQSTHDAAAAALDSMRTPTRDMIKAAQRSPCGLGHEEAAVMTLWAAMIDAALNRPPEEPDSQ